MDAKLLKTPTAPSRGATTALLIPEEDQAAFAELRRSILAAVAPADAIESIWAEDVVELVWERHRYARLRTHIMAQRRRSALMALLQEGHHPKSSSYRRVPKLIERYLRGHLDAKRRIEQQLYENGYDLSGVLAQAYAQELSRVERIDDLMVSIERRRDRLLREVERRRKTFASRLRSVSDLQGAEDQVGLATEAV